MKQNQNTSPNPCSLSNYLNSWFWASSLIIKNLITRSLLNIILQCPGPQRGALARSVQSQCFWSKKKPRPVLDQFVARHVCRVMDYYVSTLKINIFFPLYFQHLRHGTFRSRNQVGVMFRPLHDHYSSMSCINISDCVQNW